MIVVVSIAETYVQKVLVSIPDNTKNAEQVARNYEVSIAYSDDDSKFCNPDFTLDKNGKEI